MIVIASPSRAVRARCRRGLRNRFAIGQVAQRAALERSMASLKPAVLLLDLSLRRLNGIEGVSAIQRLSPRTKIVVLASAPDEREEIAALKAGAKGYCDRDIASPLIAKAVQRIQKGEVWIGRKVISSFIEELAALMDLREKTTPAEQRRRLKLLTSRELEVAYLIGLGTRNKEIANRLKVAERTVKAHVTSIFRKLGLSNRSQLTLFVAKLGRTPVRSADSRWGTTRTRPTRNPDPGGHVRA